MVETPIKRMAYQTNVQSTMQSFRVEIPIKRMTYQTAGATREIIKGLRPL